MNIRPATENDAVALLKIYAPYIETTAITLEYAVPDEREFRQRIGRTLEKYPYLVAEENSEIIGYAYAGVMGERAAYGWAAEASVYVAQGRHGRGVGKALYSMLEKILTAQNVFSLYACVACPEVDDEYLTHNSVDFHRHMGFNLVGEFHRCGCKFGRWYNIVWLEKQLIDHTDNPPRVKNFNEVSRQFFGEA